MSNHPNWSYKAPTQEKLLVTFTDWKNFVGFSRKRSSKEVFDALNEFYQMSDMHVINNGGLPVKYIGDAGLAVFKESNANEALLAMYEFKNNVDNWFAEKKFSCRLYVNCHFGEVTIGPMGTEQFKKIDVIGSTVDTCARLGKSDFLISPQAFRCLSKENRKSFKKYTPPIVYLPAKGNDSMTL